MDAFIRALNGKYVRAGTGNDPIRNPGALPTGKNFFAFDPRLIPSRMTCRLGEQLAEELIEQYKAEHNGECPPKVTINLWAVECIRNEGTMEAQALSLLGVRPVYNASNQVVGLELIPQHELKRPRVDVVFAPSGLYRDIFPELMALLDKAVSLARSADEKDNFVREHILESEDKLKQLGVQEDSLARRIASVRLFTTPSGAYGTGVSGTVQASGTWEDEKDVAEVYFDKMSHLYGQGFWGTKVEDEYTYLPKGFSKTVFKNALSGTRVALHSRTSNLYALLDNDDMFQYLGATGLAVRTIDGKSPVVMLTNLVDPSAPGQETLEKFLGREPTPEEIAAEMNMPVERVREILKISQEPVSLETPIGEEEDSHLGDFIQDDNVPVPADAAAFTLLKEQLEEVLGTLTEREQMVLTLRFGHEDGRARTLEEVGKEFNVTRERIRQIEAKALRKLRHPSRSRKLKDYLE